MHKNDGIVRRYSEDFKLKILAELSTRKYSKKKLGDIYGINQTTIDEWINLAQIKINIKRKNFVKNSVI